MVALQLGFVLSLASFAAVANAQETVYGVWIFHRHGDRTAKATPPTKLTALGYQEVLTSGEYFRERYVSSDAAFQIQNLSPEIAIAGQLTVTAPLDTVLQDSAQGFLQGLYPSISNGDEDDSLRNGTTIQWPGPQLIPIGLTTVGAGSENNGWLQDATGCGNAVISSGNYFNSVSYQKHLNATKQFYEQLDPVINGSFPSSADNFKNAYTIFDLINVAEIHNSAINGSDLLDSDTLFQLRTLADAHEWGLAYNESDNIRAIAGMQLAGEIVQFLNTTIKNAGKGPKLGIQFGAYASFLSLFGLTNLTAAQPNFYGIPDYASALVFELFTDGNTTNSTGFPAASDLQVRCLFHNGTTNASSTLVTYPLFGGSDYSVSWTDFQTNMNKFAVQTTQDWCTKCGNSTGTCAAYSKSGSSSGSSGSSGSSSSSSPSGGKHMSAAIGGVIGAFVTLAVVLGLEFLAMLCCGFRLVSTGRRASPMTGNTAVKA